MLRTLTGKYESNHIASARRWRAANSIKSTPEARAPYQRNTTLPQVKPPPNDDINTMSSFLTRPEATHSSKPIGIEADEVLPCCAMLENTFDASTFSELATESVIR